MKHDILDIIFAIEFIALTIAFLVFGFLGEDLIMFICGSYVVCVCLVSLHRSNAKKIKGLEEIVLHHTTGDKENITEDT